MSSSSEYILRKEAFVTGLNGSDWIDVVLFLTKLLIAYGSWKVLYAPLQLKRGSFIKNSSTLIMDYVCLIIPVLLACTLESFSWSWLIMQSLVSGLKWVYQWQSSKEKSSPAKGKTGQLTDQQRKSNLFSVFRGSLQFATICAILAVDFPVFPRKFAKTETFGYSLMDSGVGAFVLSSGLVSGPRLLSKTASEISIWKSSKSTFFVFLIGLGRMISTKFVGYQEHITEYGTHWNFFFTLGLVPFIVALQTKILNGLPFVLCAGSIMLGYTYALENGLKDYILNSPRLDFLSMNREGIFSFLGYYAIFLVACQVGHWIYISSWNTPEGRKATRNLVSTAICCPTLLYILTQYFDQSVSRRMTNLPYVLWMISLCLFFLGGVFVIDHFLPETPVPILFESFNRNQLALFLIANLLTGLINMSMDTLDQPDSVAFGIVAIYLLIVSMVSLLIKVKIRLL